MKELWDLVDEDRHPLLVKHVRGQKMPYDTYHLVVFIWTVSKEGLFLITKRSPEKPWGGFWENTGGSVLSGETREEGAVRELAEETGVQIKVDELILINEEKGRAAFEDTFLTIIDKNQQTIRMQPKETIDFQWVDYRRLKTMILDGDFAAPVVNRFNRCETKIVFELKQRGIIVE